MNEIARALVFSGGFGIMVWVNIMFAGAAVSFFVDAWKETLRRKAVMGYVFSVFFVFAWMVTTGVSIQIVQEITHHNTHMSRVEDNEHSSD